VNFYEFQNGKSRINAQRNNQPTTLAFFVNRAHVHVVHVMASKGLDETKRNILQYSCVIEPWKKTVK